MRAAAEHLTSVSLELGGKSPAVIDATANPSEAARKIAWGKFANNGQTCIAPDYVLVHKSQEQAFLAQLIKAIKKMYGETEADRVASPDYCRIINAQHHKRLSLILQEAIDKGAKPLIGGSTDAEDRYIAPTVLTNVSQESTLMQEEIFGPILPVLSYENEAEVFELIQEKEKPLALYIFSKDKRNIDRIMAHTAAGTTCINDNVLHFFNDYLPFGGSNNSGIGEAHGFHSFKAFSNARGVLVQPLGTSPLQTMYPPYDKTTQKLIDITVDYI